MKASDLMIGDWVLMDLNYSEEDPMYTQPNYQPYKIRSGEDIDLACETNCIGDADVYQPIQLTKEILEKNGWFWNDLPFEQCWEQYGLCLYSVGNGYRINCGVSVYMIVDSVHQLQHVLKICEIEKEIML